jgi:hypothetical protein
MMFSVEVLFVDKLIVGRWPILQYVYLLVDPYYVREHFKNCHF